MSVRVDAFGTETVDQTKIERAILEVFDLSPAGIIATLDLRRPIYRKTATYGHFGRSIFPWEATDKTAALQSAVTER